MTFNGSPSAPGRVSRRHVLKTLALGFAAPAVSRFGWMVDHPPFAIRTITAGVEVGSLEDLSPIEDAIAFLESARDRFEAAGYTVQTIRVATQPLSEYVSDWCWMWLRFLRNIESRFQPVYFRYRGSLPVRQFRLITLS